MIIKSTVQLWLCVTAAHGFATAPPRAYRQGATTPRNMLPADFSTLLPTFLPSSLPLTDAPPLSDECLIDFSVASDISESCANFLLEEGDVIEEEVTNGITHALLDFGSFWSENAVFIKVLAVIGRLVVLLHSMAHDGGGQHHLLPDELAFQLGFLGLSCHSLYHATTSKIEARKVSFLMTGKDRLAFRLLFRSAGFSWEDFREVHLQSMSWVTVEPGQVIMDEETNSDAVFWLYQGNAQVESEGKLLNVISSEDQKSNAGMIGERRLASLMDADANMDSSSGGGQQGVTPPKSYVAGDKGSTLLRLDLPKLTHFLRYNEKMTTNFGRLAFSAMQNKLQALRMP